MMGSRAYQVIFFDAAGTLFHVRGSVADIYLHHARRHGFKKAEECRAQLATAFERAFRDAPPPVFAATAPADIKQCERLWWFDIVHNVFYRIGMFERFDEFFDEVFDRFAQAATWQLYPETVDVLQLLKRRGYELGIISNFDSRLFTVLKGLGLSDFFETVTISSLAHAAKPSVRIFRQALEKHAVDPEDAMHVGDSIEEDVQGARHAGLTGILIARSGGPPGTAMPTITTLTDLDAFLSGKH